MRGFTTDSVRRLGALLCVLAAGGCFGGSGDGTGQGNGQAGVTGGTAGTTGGAGVAGAGSGGIGAGGTGVGGTGIGGAGGDGCNGQIPALCRMCADNSCGEPVCRGGMYVFVCPEDGAGGTGTGGTSGGVGCFVGGCSGQLCTDQPDAASTCEWRDEYACYQSATCERQGDGQCGWTKTAELEKCLGGGGGAFQWYQTCGDPVCQFPSPPTGDPPCKTQVAGEACMEGEAACDPGTGCGVSLVCTNSDPTQPGCPVSRREHKADIEYLDDAGRESFAREIERMRLATYRYKADPQGRTHLGFIMEDVEPSASADSAHGVVDLYGYMSMAVAALQEQRGEIDRLKKELKSLKRACK